MNEQSLSRQCESFIKRLSYIEISEQLYTLRKQESTSSKCLLVTMLSANACQ